MLGRGVRAVDLADVVVVWRGDDGPHTAVEHGDQGQSFFGDLDGNDGVGHGVLSVVGFSHYMQGKIRECESISVQFASQYLNIL